MAPPHGHRLPLSLPRRWVSDLMHACRHVPFITCERRMNLSKLVEARSKMADPPSWAAIILKGYGTVAARTPALRRSYQPFPWPHLYVSERNHASIAVARDFAGEPAVFFGFVTSPETQSLAELTAHLQKFKTEPVEAIRPFARLIRYSRYPRPIRRLLWWLGLNLTGRHRAKSFGTFALSTVAGQGATLINLIGPTATAITYGPIDAAGTIVVRLTFDHRVIDGGTAAIALQELEAELNALVPSSRVPSSRVPEPDVTSQ